MDGYHDATPKRRSSARGIQKVECDLAETMSQRSLSLSPLVLGVPVSFLSCKHETTYVAYVVSFN